MERNKKYFSNHYSSQQYLHKFQQSQLLSKDYKNNHLNINNQNNIITKNINEKTYHSRILNKIDKNNINNKSLSSISTSQKQKQNSTISSPYTYEYSILNKYKKLDQFLDMESYFNNLYGQKKLKRIDKVKSIQQQKQKQIKQKQKLTLPSIYQKQHQFYQEIMKLKIQHLQSRLNKIQPLYVIDYNRLPPINKQNCQCSCGMNHSQNPNHSNSNNQINQTQSPSINSPQKLQRRRKLLRKFRIYGIAIFFMTIFPHYSFLFGHFKLKQFLQKYLVEDNRKIRQMNQQLIQKFKQIPLYEQIRVIHEEYQQQRKLIQRNQKQNMNEDRNKIANKQQDPKIKISNQASNQNYIVNLVIKLFDQIVDSFDDQMYQFIGIGTLNTSYYGDEIFAVEQMPFIYCHPQKGNIIVNKQQQKALLLSSFILKKLVYQYLVRLAVDNQWHQQLASFSQLKKKQVQFFKLICKQLELSAFFLYQLSIKNFYNLIESQQPGNFLQQSDSSLPLPLKTMRFPSLFMSLSQKQLFKHGFDHMTLQTMDNNKNINNKQNSKNNKTNKSKNNKNNRQQSTQSIVKYESKYDWNEQQQQIFEQYKLLIQQDPLNMIHNSFQFSQLSKIISQYMKSSYQKAQKSIMNIVQKLHNKVLQKRKKNYNIIHQKVLKKKYILTKQHQILQGVIFLRGNEQKKLVSISRKMLQIYLDVLAKNQIQGGSELTTKRQLIKRKNTDLVSNKSFKSMISIVSSSKDYNNSSLNNSQSSNLNNMNKKRN